MKGKFCVLLCILFAVIISVPGCGQHGEKAPLRICFDVGDNVDEWNGGPAVEQHVKAFLEDYDVFTKDYDWARSEEFEVEIIPSAARASTERAAALQRIRTEIMTGGGPDVFVVNCQGASSGDPEDILYSERLGASRLFPYPQKAIDSGMFLPMDDYIKDAQMTDWSNQYPQVLAGGQDPEGRQVVAPLSFTVPITVFRQRDLPGGVPEDGSWGRVVSGEDPALAPQANWLWEYYEMLEPPYGFHYSGLSCLFSNVIDTEAESIAFTEEELLRVISEGIQACKRLDGKGNALESCTIFANPDKLLEIPFYGVDRPPVTIVPLTNNESGVTAKINRYCAINRNTERPLEAFRVVDCLMSQAFQRQSRIERTGENLGKMPMDMDILSPGFPLDGLSIPRQYMEEWRRVCGDVTSVHFPSPVESEMEDMMWEIKQVMAEAYEPEKEMEDWEREKAFIRGEITDEQLKDIVHHHYRRMCRLVDES